MTDEKVGQKERVRKESGRSKSKNLEETNRRGEELLGIKEIVMELMEEAMRVEERVTGDKNGGKTDKEKEGTDKKEREEEDEEKTAMDEKEREEEDKEKTAKDIRALCRIDLKVMHELRDDRTRQSQMVKKWKELVERRKMRDKQGFHEERGTHLLGGGPR